MQYRTFNKSADRLSILGLGLMRLPTTKSGKIDESRSLEMLSHALKHGVNYFDTAWVYHDGQSEPLLGRFIDQSPRKEMFVATKLPCWMVKKHGDAADYLSKQIDRLRTDYIDYYLLHSLGKNSWKAMRELKVLDVLEKAKADGKIRHIGFSFHDKYPVFKTIVNAYDWNFCQFMFNYLDTRYQAGVRGYELASEKGMGIIAMEPLRGGKLVQNVPEDIQKLWAKSKLPWNPVQRALNWIWDHKQCTVALSGMSSLDQLKENIALLESADNNPLSEEELKIYNQVRLAYIKRIAIPCTECRYCMPCPHKVAIPAVFGIYNEAVMFSAKERHTKEYKTWIPEASRADKCVQCGECVSKCPQHIPIPDKMLEVACYFP